MLRGRLTLITGGPAPAKTTTVVRVLALLQHQAIAAGAPPLRLRLAAPTGKAAARLSESLNPPASAWWAWPWTRCSRTSC